jgi:hypothetical protein
VVEAARGVFAAEDCGEAFPDARSYCFWQFIKALGVDEIAARVLNDPCA